MGRAISFLLPYPLAFSQPVQTFLAPNNVLGFGLSDFVELGLAVLLFALFLGRSALQKYALALAYRPLWCMAVLALLPVVLRLALLPHHPVPVPSGSDDFGYLLLADTLRHFRFANPPHALPEFFEQIFVLQRPTRSSMYPLGQGLVLAFGWMIFASPWAGVLLAEAALCALCYWMLSAWTTRGWALVGGLLALIEFGPLSYWMNCYWGGAVSACAGCLVFGALPRLHHGYRLRDAVLLGLGLTVQLLTRPYEFLLLLIALAVFLAPSLLRPAEWRGLPRVLAPAGLILLCGGALLLMQNKAVTGRWTTLPYMLYRYQYGVPAAFTFEQNPVPHRSLNAEQELDYRAETIIHGEGTDTPGAYWQRLVFRVRFYRFFFLAPLYLALIAFLAGIRELRFARVVLVLLIFCLGSNFFPYFYPHYIAAVTCLFLLASVVGLERLNRWSFRGRVLVPEFGTLLALICVAHFLFWYAVHAGASRNLRSTAAPYETWDFINGPDPQGRASIEKQLSQAAGRQLVFVHYSPGHMFQEWIHNAADIDSAPIVWAHDLGAEKNKQLLAYFPQRTAWLLEPDFTPPRLIPYRSEASPFQNVQ